MGITVRPAGSDDLTALHLLAQGALALDQFSPQLLGEKLFHCPRPAVERYQTWLAERTGVPIGFMQAVTRPGDGRGWLGLFAVTAADRRQGIGRELFEQVQRGWRAAGVRSVEALAIPGNYFTPGVDPRYTAGLSFLERLGFMRFKDCVNLRADLGTAWSTADDEARVADAGVEVHRASPADGGLLDRFFADHFGADWRLEAGQALANDPPALHLAIRDGELIAFSAHSTQNREWGFFGPMGTTPACRGLGIGRILLRRCLNDLRSAGHAAAIIPWVGPISFYSAHVDAVVERVFWRYQLELTH